MMVGITLIPWLLLASVLLIVIYNMSIRMNTEKLEAMLLLKAGSLLRYSEGYAGQTTIVAGRDEVRALLELTDTGQAGTPDYERALEAAAEEISLQTQYFKTIEGMYLLDRGGAFIEDLGKAPEGLGIAESGLLSAAAAKPGSPAYALLPDGAGGAEPFCIVAVADADGPVAGYVLTRISAAFFESLSANMLPGASFLLLSDKEGRALRGGDRFPADEELPGFIRAIGDAQGETGQLRMDLNGEAVLVGYRRVGPTGWTLSAGMPASVIWGSIWVPMVMLAGVILTLGVASFVIGTVYARRILSPINDIIRCLDRFRAGKFDVACDIDSYEEFRQLSDAFNEMARYLERTTGELLATQVHYKNLLDSSNDATWGLTPFSQEVHLSIPQAWREKYGSGLKIDTVVRPEEMLHPHDLEAFRSLERRAVSRPFTQYTMEVKLLIHTERAIWVLIRGMTIYDAHQKLQLIGTMVDINQSKELELRLAENEAKYRFALASMTDILYEINFTGDELIVDSGNWQSRFDFPVFRSYRQTREELLSYVSPDQAEDVRDFTASLQQRLSETGEKQFVEYQLKSKEGGYIWVSEAIVATKWEDGVAIRAIGHISDINDRKQREVDALYKARHDSLTGAYNNRTVVSEITRCLTEFPDKRQALMVIDIDDFKLFNDTYGHAVGDDVLRRVTDALWRDRKGTDFVGRMGGDEFLLYAVDYQEQSTIDKICNGVLDDLHRGLEVGGEHVPITLSIGVAMFPEDGETYRELFNKADAALYQAKRRGKNCYVVYSEDAGARSGD